MSKWNKEELENMLEDVVNELELSESAVAKHGQEGTAPAELVRLVLEEKNLRIRALEANFVDASKSNCNIPLVVQQREQFLAYHKWYLENRSTVSDSSPEAMVKMYLSQ